MTETKILLVAFDLISEWIFPSEKHMQLKTSFMMNFEIFCGENKAFNDVIIVLSLP